MNKSNFKQIWEPIAQHIREKIIAGKLHPGQRLKVLDISAKYGVSNTPVREAFRHLAMEGFLQNIPRKMVVVKEISHKEVEDIYAIQGVLEGLAARLAVRNSGQTHLKKLQNLQGRMARHLEEGNLEKFIKANQDFHQCVINASGNEKLIQIISNVRNQIQRFRSIMLHHPGRGKESLQEHEKILEALAAQDAEKCEVQVRQHVQNAAELLKKIIEQESPNPGSHRIIPNQGKMAEGVTPYFSLTGSKGSGDKLNF